MRPDAAILLTLALALAATPAAYGQPGDVQLFFEQQSLGNGGVEYSLDIIAFPVFFGPAQGTLTAPDGVVFDGFNPPIGGMDFQQLGDRFFGEWVISAFDFSTGGTTDFAFTVGPFTLDDVFSETPTITAPVASGGQVTIPAPTGAAEFELAWGYPSGAVPSSSIIRTSDRGGGGTSVADFGSGANSAVILTELDPGVASNDFVYRAGSFDDLAGFVSAVVPDDPSTAITFSATAEFRNFSEPITVTIAVPEPGVLTLACVAACGLAIRRRRV